VRLASSFAIFEKRKRVNDLREVKLLASVPPH